MLIIFFLYSLVTIKTQARFRTTARDRQVRWLKASELTVGSSPNRHSRKIFQTSRNLTTSSFMIRKTKKKMLLTRTRFLWRLESLRRSRVWRTITKKSAGFVTSKPVGRIRDSRRKRWEHTNPSTQNMKRILSQPPSKKETPWDMGSTGHTTLSILRNLNLLGLQDSGQRAEPSYHNTKKGLVGLQNIGNTCYM